MVTIENLGVDSGNGNLLGIQPEMATVDYRSEESFFQKLDAYLQAGRRHGLIHAKTIAVFPEYIGTWLVAAGEREGVYQAKTLQAGMQELVMAHLLRFAGQFIGAREKGRIEASLFRLKAPQMAAMYTSVFSRLAKTYGITIVGGSLVLPSAQVVAGKVTTGRGMLQNVSAVFRPDGSLEENMARKVYPITDELPMLSGGRLEELCVYGTPAGRLGVMICADSWYPEPYARLKSLGVEILAVPSYINHAGAWGQIWQGYNGREAPEDLNPADVGRLREGQAWRKYALAGRLAASGAKAGVNVFLQGKLWDMGADGLSILIKGQETLEVQGTTAALMNMWL